jgi:hypothetical protein
MTDSKQRQYITLSSGKVHITDPEHKRGTWCANWDIPAAKGKWFVDLTEGGPFALEQKLRMEHDSFAQTDVKQVEKKTLKECGMDSGQCGVFDDSVYPHGESTGEFDDEDSFYGQVSNGGSGVVCDEQGFNCGGFGGDGSFEVTGWFVKEVMVACEIDFGNTGEDDQEAKKEVVTMENKPTGV